MKTLRHRLALMAGLSLAAGLAAPSSPAVAAPAGPETPTVDVRPGHLSRGADPAVAHVVGQDIVDGDTVVRVRGRTLELLGTQDDSYVVRVSRRHGWRTLHVAPDGAETVVTRGVNSLDRVLSADGTRLAVLGRTRRGSAIRVVDTERGVRVARRQFKGPRFLLDVDTDRVLLGSWRNERTLSWGLDGARVRTVADRIGYRASLADDRLATYTDDPYLGGCSVVTTVDDPAAPLWRSCDDRVESFSPGAERMATIHILSDGPGPNRMTVREADGTAVAEYVIGRGWLNPVFWETATTPISDVNGRTKRALVRLDGEDTDRASDVSDSPGA